MNINNFFNPKSIAIIGASSDRNKVGYALMANLSLNQTSGERSLFPISLNETEILGHKVYHSLKEIEQNIDLALIAVKADIVPQIVSECAEKNIKNIVVISAGFKEVSQPGALLEEQIAKIARDNNISLLGPNCLGTIDTHSGLNASFANSSPKKGKTAFISQSGALGTAILDKAISAGIGFSKFVSLGNEAVMDEIDFLEYIKDDPETKAIIMYVEKIANGKKFMEITKEITKEKPIVLIKAGRGQSGQKAVMSHTGALASDDSVFRTSCKQSGIIVVDSIRELFNMISLFELGIYESISKLAILTNAGGPAVIASDLVDLSKHLSLVQLEEKTKEELKKVLPSMAGINNPIDIIGDALADRYESAFNILVKEKEIEAIITILSPQMMTEDEKTAEVLIKYSQNKKIIPVFIGGPNVSGGINKLKENGLVNFGFPIDAIEALDKLASISDRSSTKLLQSKNLSATHQSESKTNTAMLSYEETVKLLEKSRVSLSGMLVKEKDELREVMSKLGGDSFSMKVMSKDVVHKTDLGAVSLNIKTLEEAESAWDQMLSNVTNKIPNATIDGVVIQNMASGKEVIVGMKRDATFGPVILFGLGGIFTEALKDTSMRVAPVTREMALEMIREIHGFNLLNGLRGEQPVDFDKLAGLIVTVSELSVANPTIEEIDLNPVMVRPDGLDVVDARVIKLFP